MLGILASFVAKILWIGIVLLFLAGSITYAFDPHEGQELLKRSLVMMILLLLIRVLFAR